MGMVSDGEIVERGWAGVPCLVFGGVGEHFVDEMEGGEKRPSVVGDPSPGAWGFKYVAKMNVSDMKPIARFAEGSRFEKEKMRGGRRKTASGRTRHVAI